jgi:hypothetical protein
VLSYKMISLVVVEKVSDNRCHTPYLALTLFCGD